MNRRAIAILGAVFLIIVAVLVVLIIQRTRSNSANTPEPVVSTPVTETTTTPTTDTTTPTTDATSGTRRAVRLTDDQVVSPILFFQGNGISYFNRSGQLFKTDIQASGSDILLSNKSELAVPPKTGLVKILWPLTGNSYIAELSGGASKYSLYDVATASYVDLPPEVKSVDWLPSGTQILYTWVDSKGQTTLNVSDPDTKNYRTLTDLYESDNVISLSPDGQNILFYRTQTTDPNKNQISVVTADGKTFKGLVRDGYNFGVKWAPDSRQFAFGRRDPVTQKSQLWIGNIMTGEIKNTGLFSNPDKVTWTKDARSLIAAGMPATTALGSAGSAAVASTEMIYKVDVTTGQSAQADPGVSVDAVDLFLSSDEKTVFFKNNLDQALYYLPLP